MKNKLTIMAITAAAFATLGTTAQAQSADALIDKLVDKGILTTKEAQDLRDEADKNFNTAFAAKTGMSDWVTALKFNGDVRGRFESFYAANPLFVSRERFRYRLRFGVGATLMDDFEVGFKLTSSEQSNKSDSTQGGDPISGNSTFGDNGSKKLIYFDQAFARWTPLKGPDWTGSFTIGKMENPILVSDMVIDPDYTPEGFAGQFGYRLSDKHSLKLNGGVFVIDENGGSMQDPYMFAAQLRWDALWNSKWTSTVGLTAIGINGAGSLNNPAVPNINRGNARAGGDADGKLVYAHNPVIVDAAVTYMLDSFPLYPSAFPIKVGGEYMENPSAPSNKDNFAWNAGITFGKSGKRKTWEFSYTYKWLGAESQWEELVDSDFGAYYQSPLPSDGNGKGGYASGTNVKGHILKFAYSPTDSLTLSAKWFATSLINPQPSTSKDGISRLQVDALWKF